MQVRNLRDIVVAAELLGPIVASRTPCFTLILTLIRSVKDVIKPRPKLLLTRHQSGPRDSSRHAGHAIDIWKASDSPILNNLNKTT